MFVSRIRASYDRSPSGSFWFEPLGLRTASGARVTPQTALTLPTVFACVRVLAESFSVMPFTLYRGGRRSGRVTDHWLHRLFSRRPNRFQTPFEWRLMLMGHLALRGNAFCQITANSRGEVEELLPLHPDRMQVEMLDNGSYRYRYTDQTGQPIYYARTEVWHLRGLSADGIVGMSPIEVAREAIGEGLAMQSYSSRFFANDARPGGWIEVPGSFSDKATRDDFRQSWQQTYGGKNTRKVAVLERGMKYHELSLNNSDAQFIEARGYKVPEICRIFRVPPHKVADLTRATFSNIESQSIEFWTDTMLPWAKCWESSVEFFLLGPDTDLEVEFDMRAMMRGDSKSRTAYYQGGIMAGWLTRNEARVSEGYDPIEGLDDPLQPLNMVVAGEEPDDAMTPPDGSPEDTADPEDDTEDDTEDDPGNGQSAPASPQSRLEAMLAAAAGRLARRAAGALEKRSLTEVYDANFAGLVADALAIDPQLASDWCATAADVSLTDESDIARSLLQCAAMKG